MSLRDLTEDPVLAGQVDLAETIVRSIRPLTIVNEADALRALLVQFLDDPERAATVAAFAVVLLCKARTEMYSAGVL